MAPRSALLANQNCFTPGPSQPGKTRSSSRTRATPVSSSTRRAVFSSACSEPGPLSAPRGMQVVDGDCWSPIPACAKCSSSVPTEAYRRSWAPLGTALGRGIGRQLRVCRRRLQERTRRPQPRWRAPRQDPAQDRSRQRLVQGRDALRGADGVAGLWRDARHVSRGASADIIGSDSHCAGLAAAESGRRLLWVADSAGSSPAAKVLHPSRLTCMVQRRCARRRSAFITRSLKVQLHGYQANPNNRRNGTRG
jgi:hypothetical protein